MFPLFPLSVVIIVKLDVIRQRSQIGNLLRQLGGFMSDLDDPSLKPPL